MLRRKVALFLSVCGLLASSALGASTPGMAASGTAASGAPAGWEVVSGSEMAEELGVSALAAADEPRYAFESLRNLGFAATEVRYAAPNTGVLRARSDGAHGTWEEFYLLWDDTTESWSIQSAANNLFV